MKLNTYEYPKSSFLSLAKDTALIMNRILGNQRLLKLLYYTSPDYAKKPDISSAQLKEMFDTNQISNIPKVKIDEDKKTYLLINFDSFTPNGTNPYYRDNLIEIRIICHLDTWSLGDFEQRPYRIAGEIDAMLDRTHLTGIGELHFMNASQDIYDEEFAGVTLRYLAIHGSEDQKRPLNEEFGGGPDHGPRPKTGPHGRC